MTDDAILFPDAMPHLVGDVRATHTLRSTRNPTLWGGDNGVTVVAVKENRLHLNIGFPPLNDVYGWFLKWDEDKARWQVGAWPNSVLTAFLIRDVPGGKLLEIRDAVRIEGTTRHA